MSRLRVGPAVIVSKTTTTSTGFERSRAVTISQFSPKALRSTESPCAPNASRRETWPPIPNGASVVRPSK